MKSHYHIHWGKLRLTNRLFWNRMVAENYMLRYAGATNPEEAFKVKSCRSVECLVREMAQ